MFKCFVHVYLFLLEKNQKLTLFHAVISKLKGIGSILIMAQWP